MRLAHIGSEIPGKMNETLRALAAALKSEGRDVVGAVQINSGPEDDTACDMDLMLLPDGPTICISQSLGPGSSGCRLDAGRLEEAVQECSVRLARGADVMLVNKFGGHEAEGRGFRDLIGSALAADVPVIVGVSAAKREDFGVFAGGLAEELPCDVAALLAWVGDARGAR